MIMQFPVPYRDELLSSVLARFVLRHGINADKCALELLFGSRNIVPSTLFQGHIQQLLSNVGHIWQTSPEAVLRDHTLLSVFKPFMERPRYEKHMHVLIAGKKNQTVTSLGINASSLIWPKHFFYCPHCLKNDLEALGETYWRRHFQLPGMSCCPVHECQLVESRVSIHAQQRHSYIVPDVRLLGVARMLGSVDIAHKRVALAKQIYQLFQHGTFNHSLTQWSSYYQNIARSLNLVDRNGVDHSLIQSAVRAYWGDSWLNQVGLDLHAESNWLIAIFRKHRRSYSYLHHLTVMSALLGESMSIIDECRKVDALPERTTPKKSYSTSKYEAQKEGYRSAWLELTQTYSSLKEIRSTQEGARVYSWLYRFDRDWQLDHSLAHLHRKRKKHRVDWSKRDRTLVKRLLQVERDSYLELELPRKSRLWFGKKISASSLIPDKLSKLPLCACFFDRYHETVEEYQLRRLLAIVVDKINHGQSIPPIYELERRAGLSKERIRELAEKVLRVDIPRIARKAQFAGRYQAKASDRHHYPS